MGPRHKPDTTRDSTAEQAMRDQEVLRANGELAAYFKGRRTEREARAALKIIKAFVRDRGRRDARTRPPLPDAEAGQTSKKIPVLKAAKDGGTRRGRKSRRTSHDGFSKNITASVESPLHQEPSPSSKSDKKPSE